MHDFNQILYAIEVHSVEGIKHYFENGGSPNDVLPDGTPLFTMMVEMYTRTPRFKLCVKTFIEYGLVFENKALLAVFVDDAEMLEELIKMDPALISKTYSTHKNTFTPLTGGTLLHYCAEYNAIACAKVLLNYGADINAKAAFDEKGFGGHTPIFHTVNQNMNNSAEMMTFLLENSADLSYTVKGLVWGRGYEWETFIPAVNPLSYAMMGLLPQMHRNPETVAQVISILLKHTYGLDYVLPNVPNKYLKE